MQLTGAGPAVGHDNHAGDRIVIDAVTPAAAGVSVRPVTGGFGKLELRTRGRTTATVLGSDGQAILRVGPTGVYANLAAPEWYRDNEPLGIAEVPESAGADRPRAGSASRPSPCGSGSTTACTPRTDASATGRSRCAWRAGPVRVRGHIERPEGQFQIVLDEPEPLPGVRVQAFSIPGFSLRLSNTGRRPVEIIGPDRELFGRVGPDGAEVNQRSPVWVPTAQYANRYLADPVIDPGARPRMTVLRRRRS